MEELHKRFEQPEGLYNYKFKTKGNQIQLGGEIKKDLSPRSENWKKKFLEIKIERDVLKKENETLKKQLKEK